MLNVFFHDGNMPAVFYGNIFFLLILTIEIPVNTVNSYPEKKDDHEEQSYS
jgi:hypothetical protein